MAVDVRAFTMKGQFAKNAQTVIPPIPIAGQQYRNPETTKAQIEAGQAYNAVGASGLWNETMFEATGIAKLTEQFCFVPWSPYTNYIGDASWCLGQDGIPYHALQNSGPGDELNPGVGAKPPPDTAYWETMADYIQRIWNSGGGGSGGSSGLVYPTAFYDFYEQMPPAGWMVRNGGLISSANITVPKLWEALQKPENAWKLKSESEWQSISQTAPWNGIGGVPHFVLNIGANTIRLPDTRGMYKEDAGFDGLIVGGVHGDAMRRLVGDLDFHQIGVLSATGVFHIRRADDYNGGGVGGGAPSSFAFDNASITPTANKNQPRAFGVLGCVYVGPPAN